GSGEPAGGGGGPADFLGEVVVATAAGDRALRPVLGPLELPGRPRVVVEAADQRRGQLVGDPIGVEVRADRVEVLATWTAQRIADLRSVLERCPDLVVLHVEHAN